MSDSKWTLLKKKLKSKMLQKIFVWKKVYFTRLSFIFYNIFQEFEERVFLRFFPSQNVLQLLNHQEFSSEKHFFFIFKLLQNLSWKKKSIKNVFWFPSFLFVKKKFLQVFSPFNKNCLLEHKECFSCWKKKDFEKKKK